MTTEQIVKEISINNQLEKNWQKRFDFICDMMQTQEPKNMFSALAILAAAANTNPTGQIMR